MEIYQLIKRGQMHKVYCEDFLLVHPINERYELFAVFDGCSTGIDSHFASALMAKTIRAELEFIDTDIMESAGDLLDVLIFQSSQSLKDMRNALLLETDEMLSTMVVFIADKITKSGEILVFGDGIVSINGKDHQIDQNNEPEYLAYYLDMINTSEDYEKCIADHAIRFRIERIEDVSISTDGINTFKSSGISLEDENIPLVQEYLLHNDYLRNNPAMMPRKCNILKKKFALSNQDDIALIRVINN